MDILPVVDVGDAPDLPPGYTPTPWALRVAAELERLMSKGVKAALVHLEDVPRVRHVGPSRPIA